MLYRLTTSHSQYGGVKSHFLSKWKHTNHKRKFLVCLICKANVIGILAIKSAEPVLEKYESYKKRIESYRHFVAQKKKAGNEKRRFHGTKMICNLGIQEDALPCTDTDCSVCNICKNGFKKMPGNFASNRYGSGIYFARLLKND